MSLSDKCWIPTSGTNRSGEKCYLVFKLQGVSEVRGGPKLWLSQGGMRFLLSRCGARNRRRLSYWLFGRVFVHLLNRQQEAGESFFSVKQLKQQMSEGPFVLRCLASFCCPHRFSPRLASPISSIDWLCSRQSKITLGRFFPIDPFANVNRTLPQYDTVRFTIS